MNVYFDLHEQGRKSVEEIKSVFMDLNIPIPSEDRLQYHAGCGGCFAMTFNFEHPGFERMCMYTFPMDAYGELLEFMDDCSLPCWETCRPHPENSCAVSCSYDREGKEYFKQESDWHNNYCQLVGNLYLASQNS